MSTFPSRADGPRRMWLPAVLSALVACATKAVSPSAAAPPETSARAASSAMSKDEAYALRRSRVDVIEELHRHARNVEPLASTPFAKRFVTSAAALQHVTPRLVYHTPDMKRAFTAAEAALLPAAERQPLKELKVDDEYYYYTRY